MPKTIQIRDVADDVYATLRRRAAEDDISVPELLRREVTNYASKPTMREWLQHLADAPPSGSTREDTIAALDELRGPWPS